MTRVHTAMFCMMMTVWTEIMFYASASDCLLRSSPSCLIWQATHSWSKSLRKSTWHYKSCEPLHYPPLDRRVLHSLHLHGAQNRLYSIQFLLPRRSLRLLQAARTAHRKHLQDHIRHSGLHLSRINYPTLNSNFMSNARITTQSSLSRPQKIVRFKEASGRVGYAGSKVSIARGTRRRINAR